MKYAGIPYKAFGEQGEYTRDVLTISELPTGARIVALTEAGHNIEKIIVARLVRSIAFGLPVYESFGMRLADAKKHEQSKLLMTRGCDVALNHCC